METVFQGLGVSPGIAIASALLFTKRQVDAPEYAVEDPEQEWERFRGAVDRTRLAAALVTEPGFLCLGCRAGGCQRLFDEIEQFARIAVGHADQPCFRIVRDVGMRQLGHGALEQLTQLAVHARMVQVTLQPQNPRLDPSRMHTPP